LCAINYSKGSLVAQDIGDYVLGRYIWTASLESDVDVFIGVEALLIDDVNTGELRLVYLFELDGYLIGERLSPTTIGHHHHCGQCNDY
jgi:hypothetical protein